MTDTPKTHTLLRVQQNFQGLPSQIFTHPLPTPPLPTPPLPTPPAPAPASDTSSQGDLLSSLLAMLQQLVDSLKDSGIMTDVSEANLKNMIIQNPTEYQLLQALRDQAKLEKQKQTQLLVKKFKKFLK